MIIALDHATRSRLPTFDAASFAAHLSDAALEILIIRTQSARMRYTTAPGLWAVGRGDGTFHVLSPRQRPLGTLAEFIYELSDLYRDRGDDTTVRALAEYLTVGRREELLIACETPSAELLDLPFYARTVDDLLPREDYR